MFLVMDKTGAVLCVSENIQYAKIQSNGAIVLTEVQDATLAYCGDNDKFYALRETIPGEPVYQVVGGKKVPQDIPWAALRYEDGKVTTDHETLRSVKLAEISAACNAVIVEGVEVETSNGVVRFKLETEDQANINNLFRVVELGGTEFPYQAQDDSCKVYTAVDIVSIYLAAQEVITGQTTYHNALKRYTTSLSKIADLAAVQYGMELPALYADEVAEKLDIAKVQIEKIVATITARMGGGGTV